MKLNIKTGITIFGVAVAIGFAAVVFAGNAALSQLKVGGPVYGQIVLGKPSWPVRPAAGTPWGWPPLRA